MLRENHLNKIDPKNLKVFPIILGVTFLPFNTFSNDYGYLSDRIAVPLRAGPEIDEEIINRKIITGTKLRIIEKKSEENYIKVQTSKGEIGWLPAEYVVSEPPAKLILEKEYEISAKLRAELNAAINKSKEAAKSLIELETQNRDRDSETETLGKELQEIKLLAAQTIEINQNNLVLETTNQKLRQSLKQLREVNKNSATQKRYLDFLIGAGLVLLGILTGILLQSRRKTSGWSN